VKTKHVVSGDPTKDGLISLSTSFLHPNTFEQAWRLIATVQNVSLLKGV